MSKPDSQVNNPELSKKPEMSDEEKLSALNKLRAAVRKKKQRDPDGNNFIGDLMGEELQKLNNKEDNAAVSFRKRRQDMDKSSMEFNIGSIFAKIQAVCAYQLQSDPDFMDRDDIKDALSDLPDEMQSSITDTCQRAI